MYTKKNTRVTFRSNRRSNFKRNNNNFSNGKNRNKGNVTQQYNKYLKLAKEASSFGDRIQSEYYYQFTDHYYRLMLELGINLEDNDIEENKSSNVPSEAIQTIVENTESANVKKDQESTALDENENEDVESIESVPFISEPVKKKVVRNKKATA